MFACTLFAFIAIAISAHAAPSMENAPVKEDVADKLKELVSMNKTAGEKSSNAAGKSMRPLMAVPVYPPLVSTQGMPFKWQRVPVPLAAFPKFAAYSHRPGTGSYTGYQPPMYQGYQGGYQGFTRPAPMQYSRLPPLYNYQHQPLVPSTYNYAPYAANTYASYGYRNAEEEKLQSSSMEQPMQSEVQYETSYVMKPQDYVGEQQQYTNDYGITNVEYTSSSSPSSAMQPREMLMMGPQNEMRRYEVMEADDNISLNYMAPMAEPTDEIFWEMRKPYGYVVRPDSSQSSYRITVPSGTLQTDSRTYNLFDNTNWAFPGGRNVAFG